MASDLNTDSDKQCIESCCGPSSLLSRPACALFHAILWQSRRLVLCDLPLSPRGLAAFVSLTKSTTTTSQRRGQSGALVAHRSRGAEQEEQFSLSLLPLPSFNHVPLPQIPEKSPGVQENKLRLEKRMEAEALSGKGSPA